MVRKEVSSSQAIQGAWPPMSGDFSIDKVKECIPVTLFNVLAWIVGASSEAKLDDYVEVSDAFHLKMLSVLQDIIYLESNGKKQTPKSLCLGLTMRHLTGSSQVLELLSKLGHCASYHSILRYDTTLAQLQLALGDVFIPAGVQKSVPTTIVWDNVDFGEETTSGHGTTHHTNGILIQISQGDMQECSERPMLSKSERRLNVPTTTLVPYPSTRRSGPSIMAVDAEQVDQNLYAKFYQSAHLSDMAYLFVKFVDAGDQKLPGWTGFNTHLHDRDDIHLSRVAYLPTIEASPTELDTVNTILRRSLDMADNLCLKTITLVFDQAIYAKAQEIRWKEEVLRDRIVIRLGEFHTCMSFMSILGKCFCDAGLMDILIESGVVAAGSIHRVDGRKALQQKPMRSQIDI